MAEGYNDPNEPQSGAFAPRESASYINPLRVREDDQLPPSERPWWSMPGGKGEYPYVNPNANPFWVDRDITDPEAHDPEHPEFPIEQQEYPQTYLMQDEGIGRDLSAKEWNAAYGRAHQWSQHEAFPQGFQSGDWRIETRPHEPLPPATHMPMCVNCGEEIPTTHKQVYMSKGDPADDTQPRHEIGPLCVHCGEMDPEGVQTPAPASAEAFQGTRSSVRGLRPAGRSTEPHAAAMPESDPSHLGRAEPHTAVQTYEAPTMEPHPIKGDVDAEGTRQAPRYVDPTREADEYHWGDEPSPHSGDYTDPFAPGWTDGEWNQDVPTAADARKEYNFAYRLAAEGHAAGRPPVEMTCAHCRQHIPPHHVVSMQSKTDPKTGIEYDLGPFCVHCAEGLPPDHPEGIAWAPPRQVGNEIHHQLLGASPESDAEPPEAPPLVPAKTFRPPSLEVADKQDRAQDARESAGGKECSIAHCDRARYARGLCLAHYRRRLRGKARRSEVRGYKRRKVREEYVDPNRPLPAWPRITGHSERIDLLDQPDPEGYNFRMVDVDPDKTWVNGAFAPGWEGDDKDWKFETTPSAEDWECSHCGTKLTPNSPAGMLTRHGNPPPFPHYTNIETSPDQTPSMWAGPLCPTCSELPASAQREMHATQPNDYYGYLERHEKGQLPEGTADLPRVPRRTGGPGAGHAATPPVEDGPYTGPAHEEKPHEPDPWTGEHVTESYWDPTQPRRRRAREAEGPEQFYLDPNMDRRFYNYELEMLPEEYPRSYFVPNSLDQPRDQAWADEAFAPGWEEGPWSFRADQPTEPGGPVQHRDGHLVQDDECTNCGHMIERGKPYGYLHRGEVDKADQNYYEAGPLCAHCSEMPIGRQRQIWAQRGAGDQTDPRYAVHERHPQGQRTEPYDESERVPRRTTPPKPGPAALSQGEPDHKGGAPHIWAAGRARKDPPPGKAQGRTPEEG